MHELQPLALWRMKFAMAAVRTDVWKRMPEVWRNEGILDFDASLVEIHSENKEHAAPTYKGGYGFHPLPCFFDGTGETLASMLRAGNAGANDVDDHVSVLDEAITQMPEIFQQGHSPGDDPSLVRRDLTARADSAGCTHGFVDACRERNVGFCVVARSCKKIGAAISFANDTEKRWHRAVDQDGKPKKGSAVAELTDFCDLSEWPEGTA